MTANTQHLYWGIHAGFVRYVESLADGAVTTNGAFRTEPGDFAFDVSEFRGDEIRASGGVHFVGHGGAIDFELRDPWIRREGATHLLTCGAGDADDGDWRIPFAVVDASALFRGEPAEALLTEEGSDVFFGRYLPGARLDPVLLLPSSPLA
ncbi:hypothetical protein GCM10022381_33900 [Leifsonia kafniensis]|uniref:Htaa domain-containing protein n=1 Tax=Leifsonia kafniensis TaxID=475957 RepID=A0ABP7KZ09_9MICO